MNILQNDLCFKSEFYWISGESKSIGTHTPRIFFMLIYNLYTEWIKKNSIFWKTNESVAAKLSNHDLIYMALPKILLTKFYLQENSKYKRNCQCMYEYWNRAHKYWKTC